MKGTKMLRKYSVWNFILDALLVLFTGGFWFIWIGIREVRNLANSRRY